MTILSFLYYKFNNFKASYSKMYKNPRSVDDFYVFFLLGQLLLSIMCKLWYDYDYDYGMCMIVFADIWNIDFKTPCIPPTRSFLKLCL